MRILYLTPASIGYLTHFILSLAVTGYLAQCCIGKRKNRSTQTGLLTGVFAVTTVFIGMLFLDAAMLPAPRLYVVYLENTVLGAMLVLLLQFAYRFPAAFPRRKWESRMVLALSLLYTLYEAQFAVYRFSLLLGQGTVDYRSLEVSGPGISGTQVISTSFLPYARLSPLAPHQTYSITVLALNQRSGNVARSAMLTGVPLGAPLSMVKVGSPTVTIELNQSVQITLELGTTLAEYPEPVTLIARTAPAGMDVVLPDELYWPTITGAQVSAIISVTAEALRGAHVLTVTAQGIGEQAVLA